MEGPAVSFAEQSFPRPALAHRCVGWLDGVTSVLEEALHKGKTEPLAELLAGFRQSADRHES